MPRILLAFLAVHLVAGMGRAGEHWPGFRGPTADGVVVGSKPPETWSKTENIAWEVKIPGRGWGSPIVWGNKVIVTSAVGKDDNPKMGRYGSNMIVKPEEPIKYTVFCLDAATGKVLWERIAHEGVPPQPRHVKNNDAPETPITDGERIYAYFGNIGLFCYDMDGKKLWEKKYPPVKMRSDWGTGSSPCLYKDRLYLVNDNETKSYVVALDKRTGAEIWKVDRPEKSNWSTPYVWETKSGPQLVIAATGKSRAYDLDGKLLWEVGPASSITISAPVAAGDLVFVGSGFFTGGPLYAVKSSARGSLAVKKEPNESDGIAWVDRKAAAYHTSPLVVGDRLYVILDQAFASCYDVKTGKPHYERVRINGVGEFCASPWFMNGKIFALSESGATVVIKEGPEFEVLGVNRLDESALAAPAIAGDSIYLRTLTRLYRIAKNAK